MFTENTPIEEYKVGSTLVFVKREDLYGQPPMPPLAKLRGIRVVLDKMHKEGIRKVGILDTRVSKSGQGVAAICRYCHPDIQLMLGYPILKDNNFIPWQHKEAESLGAKLYPLQATRQAIMWYKFRKVVHEANGVLLPHGLPFLDTALSVSRQAAQVSQELLQGSLVLIVGTGTMLSGILQGLPAMPKRVVGISAGKAPETQYRTMKQLAKELSPFMCQVTMQRLHSIELLKPIMLYHEPDHYPCPFPSHPNYDRKAWHWLCEHIDELPRPILFWNIGA